MDWQDIDYNEDIRKDNEKTITYPRGNQTDNST